MKTQVLSLLICFITTATFSQCYQDRHNTSLDEAWVTCTKQDNPNSSRGNSHWIMYDFQSVQQLGSTHIWNINSPDRTSMGIKDATIDYSVDNTNWIEWGKFNLQEADASGFYEGEPGPDLSGVNARYLLITVSDNYGSNCVGLAEIKIETFGESTDVADLSISNSSLACSPNPAVDYTTLMIDSPSNQKLSINLNDILGKTILQIEKTVYEGKNNIRLPLSNIPTGQYLISVANDKALQTTQLSIINP